MIEKGLYQPEKPEPAGPSDRGFLVRGSMLGGIGIALVVSTFPFHIDNATVIPGFIFLLIGLALLIVYAVARKRQLTSKD